MPGGALIALPFQTPKLEIAGQQRQCNMRRAAYQDAERRKPPLPPSMGARDVAG